MTTKERLTAVLNGETPDITPYSIYHWLVDDRNSDRWRPLIERGLGLCRHVSTVHTIEHGVEDIYEEKVEGGIRYTVHTRKTPVGAIRQGWTDNWHTEYFVKDPQDYQILQWIVEHTEYQPNYGAIDEAESYVGDDGIVIPTGSRSPAMSINVDWAGTEQFCMDLALEVPELLALYEACTKKFIEETQIIAAGPGRFIKWFENLTISMLGPQRYNDLLMSVYKQTIPLLEQSGKRVFVHYDGALNVIADQIAAAPFHGIESLTEPPEGDMTYDQCRAAWPDKVFWANINLDCYNLPPEALRAEVIAKRTRAGKRAFAFEVSEDLPANWQQSFPVVLQTLEELG